MADEHQREADGHNVASHRADLGELMVSDLATVEDGEGLEEQRAERVGTRQHTHNTSLKMITK